jgi:hypothetical protein
MLAIYMLLARTNSQLQLTELELPCALRRCFAQIVTHIIICNAVGPLPKTRCPLVPRVGPDPYHYLSGSGGLRETNARPDRDHDDRMT